MGDQGLFGKYIIKKADGSPVDPDACYFVLRLDTDPAAQIAVRAYAEATDNEELAEQIKRAQAEAQIYALSQAGYVIVPREPTEEMLDAADSLRVMRASRSWNDEVWQAMIAAFENEDKAMKGGG